MKKCMHVKNSKSIKRFAYATFVVYNKSQETNQKPAGGFLIAHFKRYE